MRANVQHQPPLTESVPAIPISTIKSLFDFAIKAQVRGLLQAHVSSSGLNCSRSIRPANMYPQLGNSKMIAAGNLAWPTTHAFAKGDSATRDSILLCELTSSISRASPVGRAPIHRKTFYSHFNYLHKARVKRRAACTS